MITTVLFDLDGTLLPMDLDRFLERYFELLINKLSGHGYHPKSLVEATYAGINAMMSNDGAHTNEDVFWKAFCSRIGKDARQDIRLFQEFYEQDFDRIKEVCDFDPMAKKAITAVKERGLRVVLATNPLYPAIATQQRIRWAGLQPEDFELYTTYEDTYHCKPNPAYYQDILDKLHLTAEECLMVGNDVTEDMVAAQLGIRVFLLPRCLLNRNNLDITSYPQGDFEDLLQYIDQLQKMD